MNNRIRLRVESLESREVPATFGVGWQSRDITVSIAPDGAVVDGVKSDLLAKLSSSGVTETQFRDQVTRALQTWATAGNINFGWNSDDGSRIAETGMIQGDTRFGDIRIFGRPLAGNVLAITTPPSQLVETRSGDIIINTNMLFGIGAQPGKYDLYTTLLQETGHAVGLGNSSNNTSVMYETYSGVRTGLAATDVTALTSIYGQRTEAVSDDKLSTATPLTAPTGTSTLYTRAELSRSTDVDFYRFTTPTSMPSGLTVQLRTQGLSFLSPRIEIQNTAGKVLASANGTFGANTTLKLSSAKANTTYILVVRGPGGTFPVGTYQLSVVFDATAIDPATQPKVTTYVDDKNTNNTITTATILPTISVPGSLASYQVDAQLSPSDPDVYKFVSPNRSSTQFVTLRDNGFGLLPFVEILDANGNKVAAERVVADGIGSVGLQFTLPANTTTYVRVSTGGLPFGVAPRYSMNVDFRPDAIKAITVAEGTLMPGSDVGYGSLVITRPQVISYTITTVGLGSKSPFSTSVVIYDRNGNMVTSWGALANSSASRAVLLMPGEYAIKIDGNMSSTSTNVQYTLSLLTITDPIGISSTDPNYVPPPTITTDPIAPSTTDTSTSSKLTTDTASKTTTTSPTVTEPVPTYPTTTSLDPTGTSDFSWYIQPLDYYSWLMPMM